jgi:sirohydrochlorin ferrochelatase
MRRRKSFLLKRWTGAREHLGEEDPFTLRVMNSLSQVLREGVAVLGTEEQQLDVLHEAEAQQRAALAGRTKVCGSEHPDTLTSMYQLGRVLQDLERYGEAGELYEKALAGFEVKLGSEHETTKECRKHLAFT